MPYKDSSKQRQFLHDYQKSYHQSRYILRKQKLFEYLGGKCVWCGSKENLEFDHVEASTKVFSIMKKWNRKWDILQKELEKCQLLCHNCHLKKSELYQDGTRGKPALNRVDTYNHGSGYMYNKDKCRCSLCQAWKRRYRNKEINYTGEVIN